MDYKIEKDVPLPALVRRRSKYPFKDLEIGDSFVIPIKSDKSPSGIYAAISTARSRHNIGLTTARVEGGIRVWRVPRTPQESEAP
jgi:hypothetical protein